MCGLDVKQANFGGAHEHIVVEKLGLNDDVATEMKYKTVNQLLSVQRNKLPYLRTFAGIICDSGAASMSDCHVLVEFGMT